MVTAFNIVILPMGKFRDLVIKLSEEISSSDFHLNDTDLLPHITLAMGFTDDLNLLKGKISEIVKNFSSFEVVIDRAEKRYLFVEKNEKLFNLHEQLMNGINFVEPSKKDMEIAFSKKPNERVEENDYILNFRKRNVFENFVPHITLGWDDAISLESKHLQVKLPIRFIVSEISLCHSGSHNTCRIVLERFSLK